MKELDKAIINHDIKHIKFLLSEGIDCKGAVLMHLKEALIPYFSVEELQKKGAILGIDALKTALSEYLTSNRYDYRYETYLKRLYLTLQQALKAWQEGKIFNEELEADWNKQALGYLTAQWIKEDLPQNIQNYIAEKQKNYITYQYQQWQKQSLESVESRILDEVLYEALARYWYSAMEATDVVTKQIKDNILDQAVEFYRNERNNDYADGIKQFIHERVVKQIYDSSINGELVKDAIEQEKECLLKGGVTPNPMPYYKKGIDNLFTKWQDGGLDISTSADVTNYIKKQLKQYEFPGKLNAFLAEKAIHQLLKQYKNNALSSDVMENLQKQFEGNITGYYEKNASKETPFRNELARRIFADLLNDWKHQTLTSEVGDYLQRHLLTNVQTMLQHLSFYTSRSALATQVKQLEEIVVNLQKELSELKGNKQQVIKLEPVESGESAPILSKVGLFK